MSWTHGFRDGRSDILTFCLSVRSYEPHLPGHHPYHARRRLVRLLTGGRQAIGGATRLAGIAPEYTLRTSGARCDDSRSIETRPAVGGEATLS